ncbi:DNA replication endonuclease-helicase Dna2 [Rhizina undulata]
MSRRPTASFFDQDHSAKAKSGFYRKNRDASHKKQGTAPASARNTSSTGPGLPVSADAKAKLNAFAFDKANPPRGASRSTKKSDEETENKDAVEPEEENELPGPASGSNLVLDPVKECPQTPAPRLPISDLIPLGEEGKLQPIVPPLEMSPQERIKSRQPKKRAASSSPPNSPQIGTTPLARKRRRAPLEAKTPARIPKTPMVDPAVQLWNKYSSTADSGRTSKTFNPSVRLFNANGPQTPSSNHSPSGLRRSYSCGPEWPQTRLKRRKTNSTPEDIQESEESPDNDDKADNADPGSSRLSRVSRLVDKVKRTLGHPQRPPLLPSSSSPLPDSGAYDDSISSPVRRGKQRSPDLIPEEDEDATSESTMKAADVPGTPESHYFGDSDDELDPEILQKVEEIEAAIASQAQSQAPQSSVSTSTTKPVPDPGPGSVFNPATVPPRQPQPAPANESEDEYGELDESYYDEEVQQMLAKYDTPSLPQPTQSSPKAEEKQVAEHQVSESEAAFLAEFGDIDFDEWEEEARAVTDDITADGKTRVRSIKRYQAIEVSESQWEWKGGITRAQRVLRVKDERNKVQKTILLRDAWFHETRVYEGDYIHLVGSFDISGVCIVDNAHNMVILHPDFLVSSTTVADSFSCMRKAVLQDRVKATGDISKPMVYGNILHALWQAALEGNDFTTEFLHTAIDIIIIQHVESFYVLKEEISVARDHTRSKIPLIQNWANTFVSAKPKRHATVTDHRGTSNPIVAVNKVLDIEEHVWSPMYGLKGNIDATVQATIIDGQKGRTLTIPLELKTGMNSKVVMHRAQTMLYTLLMTDRYDIDVQCGLLYYMEAAEMIRVPAIREELRGMIMSRNELATYSRNRDKLPPMLRSKHNCERCYAQTQCFLYHKLLEDGTPETSGVEKHFYEQTKHLGESHKKFFKHWDGLLSKEERDLFRFRRELWTMLSSEREALGRCFGDLSIVPGGVLVSVGEPIVISDENGHFALAMGYVTDIRRSTITVQIDRKIHNARTRRPGFHEENNQVFSGIVEITEGGKKLSDSQVDNQELQDILYRLDKDEFSNGMALVRNNLMQLFAPDSSSRPRELIVDLVEPVFKESPTAYPLDASSQTNLNEDQRRAVEKVMSARDYALVLGMPGTGKTTTIAHIIRALVAQGKSVLLTSYTHTAVDNILLKIRKDKIKILRLGSGSKIHPDVKEFAELAVTQRTTFEELRSAFHEPRVVATTCLGIHHPIFNERKFDYCIVDEASQITLPVCVGPIRLANTFVLVGDHYQLPPLVKDTEARKGGLDISLFKLLSETHPQAVVNLEHQYRMCEEIMTLSNELIYSRRLKCGTEEVAKRMLKIPELSGLENLHQDADAGVAKVCLGVECWMKDLFDEKVKACFVNTDDVCAREERLVEGFLSCGLEATSIGVISVYRSQLKLIQNLLRKRTSVEMHTADKFQGRDKEIIIISLVRSNDQENVGELLRDWRRINVAFTRARTKLLILGSKSTLQCNDLLAKFIDLMDRNNWIYDLPSNAHQLHSISSFGRVLGTHLGDGNEEGVDVDGETKAMPKRINGRQGVAESKEFLGNRPILRDIVNGVP